LTADPSDGQPPTDLVFDPHVLVSISLLMAAIVILVLIIARLIEEAKKK
jgi:hypothetical protein